MAVFHSSLVLLHHPCPTTFDTSSLHLALGLLCVLLYPYGIQTVVARAHLESSIFLILSAHCNFLFNASFTQSRTLVSCLILSFVHLSRNVILSILLSIFLWTIASLSLSDDLRVQHSHP